MMHVSCAALGIAGVVHLLPVSGVMGIAALKRLYGVDVTDRNTSILLQHRALLFGLLGLLMLSAVFLPELRLAALCVGLCSAMSFVVVAKRVGDYNRALARIVVADLVASFALVVGLAAELSQR